MSTGQNYSARVIEALFMDGHSYNEIAARYRLKKDVVYRVIYRARHKGRVPRPISMAAYDDRRNSYIKRGTVSDIINRLSKGQHKYLTDEALRIGCNSLAEMIAAYVIDGISEEMAELEEME